MSDERIRTACPECGAHLAVPPGAVGRRVRCPKCQAAFRVEPPPETPPTAAAPLLDDDLLAGLGAGSAVETTEARQARMTAAATAAPPRPAFESPAVPQTVAATSGGFAWSAFFVNLGRFFLRRAWNTRLCGGLMGAGIGLIVWGVYEFRLRAESSDVPATMTCAEFQSAASIPNRHIILTEFVLLPDYVYEERFGQMRGAMIPAVPAEFVPMRLADEFRTTVDQLDTIPVSERERALNRFTSRDFNWRVLIRAPRADSERYIERLGEAETIEGMYMYEGFSGFDDDQQRLLRQMHPSVDFTKCRILVAGRERTTAAGASGLFLGGLLALLAGLGYAARVAMSETIA